MGEKINQELSYKEGSLLSTYEKNLKRLQEKREKLLETYTEASVQITAIDDDIADQKKLIEETRKRIQELRGEMGTKEEEPTLQKKENVERKGKITRQVDEIIRLFTVSIYDAKFEMKQKERSELFDQIREEMKV